MNDVFFLVILFSQFCYFIFVQLWGLRLPALNQVGWRYGSTTKDIHTGLMIHKRGWRSIYCTPSGGPTAATQQKRWTTGLLEILFSKSCPLFATLFGKLHFRQWLAYLWILTWGMRPVFELCYAALPAYCIFTNSHFLPKVRANLNPPISMIYKSKYACFDNSLIWVSCIIVVISLFDISCMVYFFRWK